jgi:hypothetical protein
VFQSWRNDLFKQFQILCVDVQNLHQELLTQRAMGLASAHTAISILFVLPLLTHTLKRWRSDRLDVISVDVVKKWPAPFVNCINSSGLTSTAMSISRSQPNSPSPLLIRRRLHLSLNRQPPCREHLN